MKSSKYTITKFPYFELIETKILVKITESQFKIKFRRNFLNFGFKKYLKILVSAIVDVYIQVYGYDLYVMMYNFGFKLIMKLCF